MPKILNVVFLDINREDFFPFTMTRPLANLVLGMSSLDKRWCSYLQNDNLILKHSYYTEKYLSKKYRLEVTESAGVLLINPQLIPDKKVLKIIEDLGEGEAFFYENNFLFAKCSIKNYKDSLYRRRQIPHKVCFLENRNDFFFKNEKILCQDYYYKTQGKVSEKVSTSNLALGKDLFVEQGAKVQGAIINSETGPVYISKDAEIMEGSMIRGPFFMGENAVVKMGAKIYGATTVAKFSKVGGELSNVVFQEYSNKSHDGFLGNSVIGQWCNFGADSNCSNLKNTYGNVRSYDFTTKNFKDTGLQYCGLMFGDHSKCAINSSFNTGTVVGIFANIFGVNPPKTYVKSFKWGNDEVEEFFLIEKAHELAKTVMKRRGVDYTSFDREIINYIFNNY